MADIHTEFPFPKTLVLIVIKGQDLKQTMEQALRGFHEGAGYFPQISRGNILCHNPDAPVGQRLKSLHIAGSLVEDDKIYKVLLSLCNDMQNDFLENKQKHKQTKNTHTHRYWLHNICSQVVMDLVCSNKLK